MLDAVRTLGADPERLQELRNNLQSPVTFTSPFDPASVRILAPMQRTEGDIVCVGLNYRSHIDETAHVEDFTNKEATVYFAKRADSILGPGDRIPDYDFVDQLDYEVELGVILGRDVRGYDPDRDPNPVFGYTVFNDLSARNLQFLHKQWFIGKSLDGYTAMGPCIVTADEAGNIDDLRIACSVNEEIRQEASTRQMITRVPELIRELSKYMTLRAGTVIATGTPGGVALGMEHPRYLKSGDRVVCEIEGIGKLENLVG
ncbi:MAG: fumarylacetoacetate hydrolase family protein [Clostridia bacterium]|nr:fumarylacetoacetate hydrolase family protein [Clostridia bacterium]